MDTRTDKQQRRQSEERVLVCTPVFIRGEVFRSSFVRVIHVLHCHWLETIDIDARSRTPRAVTLVIRRIRFCTISTRKRLGMPHLFFEMELVTQMMLFAFKSFVAGDVLLFVLHHHHNKHTSLF